MCVGLSLLYILVAAMMTALIDLNQLLEYVHESTNKITSFISSILL